ncbi:MAG TPA: 50S ribosomal protein L30, partial [Pelovirga sp.]|nr:50S ribosomal protein L30 [Pelovirga sp.]
NVLKGLGFRRMNQTVILQDTPEIRGMIRKVEHMVVVED